MQQRWIILAGLAVLVLAGLAAFLLLGQPQPTTLSNISEDKGGLIKFTPDPSTPQPTGPVEPTQPPTLRPTTVVTAALPTATSAPVIPTATSASISTPASPAITTAAVVPNTTSGPV